MKRILFIIVFIASLFIIKSLITSIYSLWQKQDLIAKTTAQLEKEKAKNEALQQQLEEVESPQFIEQAARNKLFMVKEGEQGVLIAKNLLSLPEEGEQQAPKPNWKQWIELFF